MLFLYILNPFNDEDYVRRLEKEGRIITRNYNLCDGRHVTFRPQKMSAKELEDKYNELYKKFYRPVNIIKRFSFRYPLASIALAMAHSVRTGQFIHPWSGAPTKPIFPVFNPEKRLAFGIPFDYFIMFQYFPAVRTLKRRFYSLGSRFSAFKS